MGRVIARSPKSIERASPRIRATTIPSRAVSAPIVESLSRLGHEAILDREIVVVDDQGVSHFQLLQNYQKAGKGRLLDTTCSTFLDISTAATYAACLYAGGKNFSARSSAMCAGCFA